MGKKLEYKTWEELNDRQKAFLAAYLDENADTFCNATKSYEKVYKVKYNTAVSAGPVLAGKLSHLINKWFDEEGLSDDFLKGKLRQLANAKTTKFFAHEGKIVDKVDIDDNTTQVRAVDLGLKVKGLYSPEKREVTLSGLEALINELQRKSQGAEPAQEEPTGD